MYVLASSIRKPSILSSKIRLSDHDIVAILGTDLILRYMRTVTTASDWLIEDAVSEVY